MKNLMQKYRPNGISVTDLAAQLWCEKKFEFSLERGEKETEAKRIGRKRHRELHEETATLVEVEPKTVVDCIASRLYNIQMGLLRLNYHSYTRELPLFGKINSLFIVGVTDELTFRKKRLYILDTKTRQRNSMPTEAQRRTTRFQLMLYNKLICDLRSKKFTTKDLLNFYDFTSSDKISDNFKKQINDAGMIMMIQPNIKKASDNAFSSFRWFPIPEKTMKVRYEFQENKELIGEDEFNFNLSEFKENLNFVEEFWLGKRKAVPVGIKNAWKCNYCEFNNICKVKPQ